MIPWEKQRRIYERKTYRIVQEHVSRILKNIPYKNATLSNYEYIIDASVTKESINKMYVDIYKTIGIDYGNKVNNSLEKVKKANVLFNEYLLKQILLYLSNEGGVKIVSVRDTLVNDVIKSIKDTIGENATIIDLQNAIYAIISKSQTFYKWQSLRIARTETTSASNFAGLKTAENSDLVLDKIWISVQDDRTRVNPFDHLDMDKQKQDLYKPFFVGGESIQYPGDTKASVGNVINCRCGLRYEPRRDLNGDLILKK